MVLTAAHCLFDKRTGERVDLEDVDFLAGWRDGRAAAQRRAKRVVLHPSYNYRSNQRFARVGSDIVLIELDHPIRNTRIVPFAWAKHPRNDQQIQVVSHSKERAQVLSLQETCHVLGYNPNVLVLSCQVTFGASGSPIFVIENGIPRIASVVSVRAEWNERPRFLNFPVFSL